MAAPLVVSLTVLPASAESASAFCGDYAQSEDAPAKQINLVLDDSGSMFFENRGETLLDRWSKAKYALEVFAALMGPSDTLKVYLLSDFDDADDSKMAEIELSGTESRAGRVQEIRSIQLRGEATPFLAVEEAAEDLAESSAPERWLVVVTDGKFELTDGTSVEVADLDSRTRAFVEGTQIQGNPIKVAYLAIGQGIPVLTERRDLGIYSEQAQDDQQLLLKMNELADRVYGRDADDLPASGRWAKGEEAVDMEQMIVFAQGAGVQISPMAQTENGGIEATDVVDVSWSDNAQIRRNRVPLDAIPDKSLQGQVAFFESVPRGDVQFDISNARSDVPVRVFFKPKVSLGYKLFDDGGNPVEANEPIAGTYTVEYGFLDSECNPVKSSLLGDQQIERIVISQGNSVIAENFASGSAVDFPKGEVNFDLFGTYLDGVEIANPVSTRTRVFAQPPLPGEMQAEAVSYSVSELGEFPPTGKQIPLRYSVIEEGTERAPTQEEWEQLDPSTFTLEHDSNLEFEVQKKPEPGELALLVRAPEGDVFAADTGDINVTVRGSYLPSQSETVAETTVPIEIVDDLSFWDRLVNWFKDIGWKLLLALLLLLLIIGYLTKNRFSKKVKRRPAITGTPKSVGVTAIEDRGKFQAGGFRKFLPFVANTATLSYVPPGTVGFRTMRLKAGPRKSMIVTNWKEIAEKDNVEINGNPLNSETKRPPKLSPSGTITASTPQMTYELTPRN